MIKISSINKFLLNYNQFWSRMIKTSLTFILFLLAFACFAQEDTVRLIPKQQQRGFLQVDFLPIKMPSGEENLSLNGIHYNLNLNKNFYAGLGYYGSLFGKRGGFFILGVRASVQQKITKHIFLDAGAFFGGGGGADAPDGGGAALLAHANMGYQFPKFSVSAGYNYTNFFDGGLIKGSQLNYIVRIPFKLNYAPFSEAGRTINYKDYENTDWNTESRKIDFSLNFNQLKPLKKSRQITGGVSLVGKTIQMVGFELSSYLGKNNFLFARADGAYKGIKGGYLDVLLGYGHQFTLFNDRTSFALKFGLGPGGGGDVDTQGGLLIYPDISVTQKIWKNFNITLNKGYLMTPNQHFLGSTFGFGLQYNLYQNGFKYGKDQQFRSAIFSGLEIIAAQEIYFNAEREDFPTENMQQILTQINFFLKKQFYVATHVSFANFGNAGAYGEGAFGLGITTSDKEHTKFKAFAQVLAGGSGGGNISVGQGLILKPSIGLQYHLLPALDLRTSLGHVKALDGSLNSSSLNFGLSYKIALLRGRL